MRNKLSLHILKALAAISILAAIPEPVAFSYDRDSIVTNNPDGSVTVTYVRSKVETVPNPKFKLQQILYDDSSTLSVASLVQDKTRPYTPPSGQYSVGAIPIQSTVSPSGARIYNIPIEPGPSCVLAPQISLSYNSQSGHGLAGYGWNISGLSSISVRNKNLYYDGRIEGTLKDERAEYSLDGAPLVISEVCPSFDYSTTNGSIQVVKNNSEAETQGFTVYYPDGKIATFSDISSLPVYPITELKDMDGHIIEFNYDCIEGVHSSEFHIKEIKYGKNSKIAFIYDWNPEESTYGFNRDVRTRISKILKEIQVIEGDQVLIKYLLTHEVKDGVCLLRNVDMFSGESSLPPVSFSYGIDRTPAQTSNIAKLKDAVQLPEEFVINPDCDKLRVLRGKVIPGSTSDCIVVLPQKKNYTTLEHTNKLWDLHRSYKYGSEYDKDDQIHVHNNVFTELKTSSILAEEGFQTIDVLDIDGDGVDEIVKINNEPIRIGNAVKTRFNVKKYSFKSNGAMTSKSFCFDINADASNKYYDNPIKSWYYYGDFRGNGRNMLLIITERIPYFFTNDNLPSRFVLVDLDKMEKVCEQTLYDVDDDLASTMDKEMRILRDGDISMTGTADFENDGQTDLFHITDSGVDIYQYDDFYKSFVKGTTYGGINIESISSLREIHYGIRMTRPALYTLDLNGDGYLDIASTPCYFESESSSCPVQWICAMFTGKKFEVTRLEPQSLVKYVDDEDLFLDVNKDGLPDLIHAGKDDVSVYLNKGDIFPGITFDFSPNTPNRITEIGEHRALVPCDKSYFGHLGDFLTLTKSTIRRYDFPVNHETLRQIEFMTDSYGNVQENSYKSLTTPGGPYSIDLNRSFDNDKGFSRPVIPLSVVSEERSFSMGKLSGHVGYTYSDAIVNNKGLGFCGFGKLCLTDYLTDNRTERVFDPEKLGVLVSETLYANDEMVSRSIASYDDHSTEYGKLTPRLIRQENTDCLKNVSTISEYEYGNHNLPTRVETRARIGNGDYHRSVQMTKYGNNSYPGRYVIGTVVEQIVTSEIDGDESSSWRQRSVTEYDYYFHPIRIKEYTGSWNPHNRTTGYAPNSYYFDEYVYHTDFDHGTDSSAVISETRIIYDSRGNVLSKKSSTYGGTEFLGTTYTYDSDGRYLLTETNALGQTTTYSGYNKFGKPETVTDHKGNVTRMYYDDWGNSIRTVSPDGEETSTSTAWGGEGLYTVSSTSNAGPRSITHYDALGRDIRSGAQRFDGSWLFTDKVYDERGRLYKTSLPFRGDEATLWAVTEYDKYDRIVKVSEPAGKETLISYSGASVTTTKDGITSTSTSDASGNVISVTDAGGTISYSFRDDGQPAAVTAPGNAVTTFTYDRYGRRTSIADPSAGTRTESYKDNPDGSSVVTSTNPNGTITTYSDKYGRTTKVERRGEYDTEYIYDAEGRLLSEVSTNGTSTSYIYDGLDRVVSSTETVPDGYWLKTSFEFLSNGALGATQYENNEGVITTVSYEYRNGCSVGERLSDGTYVSKLLAENDLGLPTRIQTGGIFRDYEYTETGLPVRRKLDDGHLQNFRYNFDAQTGNLLMRQDALNGQTEAFEYDNLNRLTRTGARQFSYDALGNIVSMDGVGTMRYNNASRPYQVSSLSPADGGAGFLLERAQTVSYTCYSRPSRLNEGGRSASFTYNGNGDRVKMHVADGQNVGDHQDPVLDRYYIGGVYEYDRTYIKVGMPTYGNSPRGFLTRTGKTIERLYLGGDAYSAPMVYIRERGEGLDHGQAWTLYNIGRDYLGSITHIATADGDLVAEYSYDPWGRLRNPQTLEIYEPGSEPELFLGRGYTSHEHLSWFGLINMNARLYDPLLGRFLSPDPYVQAPDFTQNFNRYSYALNNPLRYTDESGEYIHLVIGAVIGGISNWLMHGGDLNAKGLGYFVIGAAAGALSAGIGAGISSSLPVASITTNASTITLTNIPAGGFWAGFCGTQAATTATTSFTSGLAIGSGAGFTGGFVTGLGNARCLEGESFRKALRTGLIDGAIGALCGGLTDGFVDGMAAVYDGRLFWNGALLEDESILADANLPPVEQNALYNCGPAAAESTTGISQDVYRNYIGGDPEKDPVKISKLREAISELSGRDCVSFGEYLPKKELQAKQLANLMNKGHRFILNSQPGEAIGHATALNKITLKTFIRPSGKRYIKVVYQVMNPNGGVFKNVNSPCKIALWIK